MRNILIFGLIFSLGGCFFDNQHYPEIETFVYGKTAPGQIYTGNAQIENYQTHRLSPGQKTLSHAMIFSRNGDLLEAYKFAAPYGMNFGQRPGGGYFYAQAFLNEESSTEKHPQGEFWRFLDENWQEVSRHKISGKPHTDGHEILFLKNRNLLLMSYDRKIDGTISTILQEQDLSGNVVWEWDSLDYISPNIAYESLVAKDGDYAHANSIFETDDNRFIVSFRNTSQVIKLDRITGEIVWRMGGKDNEFRFIDDPLGGFSAQHHAQILENGHLLLYDNGNQHEPPQSRVVEYALDEKKKTARLAWSYQIDGKFTPATGSVQRLPNGHTLIGWGSPADGDTLRVSELNHRDEVVLEIHFPSKEVLYRAYKY